MVHNRLFVLDHYSEGQGRVRLLCPITIGLYAGACVYGSASLPQRYILES